MTMKKSTITWSLVRDGRKKASFAELRIPFLNTEELLHFDEEARRVELARVAADLQHWRTLHQHAVSATLQ